MNNNTHLDDLFAKARADADAMPELDDENVRRLLEDADSMQPSTVLTTRKKGIRIMLGFTALASLITIVGLSLNGELPVPESSRLTTNNRSENRTAQVLPSSALQSQPRETKTEVIRTKDIQKSEAATVYHQQPEETKVLAPMQVDGITPTKLTGGDLPKLGLEDDPEVGITFIVKNGSSYKKMAIPENGWGITDLSDKVTNPDVVINPMLITDARGNKRYIHIADENSMFHMQRMDKMPSNINVNINREGKNIAVMTNEHSVRISTNDSTTEKQIVTKVNINKNVKGNRNAMVIQSDLSTDSLNCTHFPRIERLDTIVNRFGRKALTDAENAFRDLHIDIDTGISDIDVKIDMSHLQDLFKQIDTSGAEMAKSIITVFKNMTITDGDSLGDGIFKSLFSEEKRNEFHSNLAKKFNELVPVLVREATTVTHNNAEQRDYDNGVIFWLDIKDASKLTNHSPSLNTNESKNTKGLISNLVCYPNPASSKTSVRFTLSEERNVAFSIHDITGKQMINIGTASFSAGEQRYELPLESLSSGIYLVVLSTDKGEQSIQRIVIEK